MISSGHSQTSVRVGTKIRLGAERVKLSPLWKSCHFACLAHKRTLEVRVPLLKGRRCLGAQQRSLVQHSSLRMPPLLLTLALGVSLPPVESVPSPTTSGFVELAPKLGAQPSGSTGYNSPSIISNPHLFCCLEDLRRKISLIT